MNVKLAKASVDEATDVEIESLLHVVYVAAGFTSPELARSTLSAAAVRQRGELVLARGLPEDTLLGMVIVVPPTSPARHVALGGAVTPNRSSA